MKSFFPVHLEGMDTSCLLKVAALHESRRRILVEALSFSCRNIHPRYPIPQWHIRRQEGLRECRTACLPYSNSPVWGSLVAAIMDEIDNCPRGDTLRRERFRTRPLIQSVGNITCACLRSKSRLDIARVALQVWRVLDDLSMSDPQLQDSEARVVLA